MNGSQQTQGTKRECGLVVRITACESELLGSILRFATDLLHGLGQVALAFPYIILPIVKLGLIISTKQGCSET